MHKYPPARLISNDGLGVMELPYQGQTMQQKKQNTPDQKQMLKISPLKYIVFNNPQAVHDLLIERGYNPNGSVASAFENAKKYTQDGGEKAVLDIVRNVPTGYKDLVLKAYGKEDKFNGDEVEQPASTELPKNDVKTVPEKETGVFKITTQTVIIVLLVIVFFLIITRQRAK